MAESLIIVTSTALDWMLAFGLWWLVRGAGSAGPQSKRGAGSAGPQRELRARPGHSWARWDWSIPWGLLQAGILVGLVVTGALGAASPSAVVLTAVPVAIIAAFLAVPVALLRARGGRPIPWRMCLDHSVVTLGVWSVALILVVAS